ncbi:RepB family plasmid replication initiator protein [Pseudomonas shahriarae]|uniref:RepB family plasmid replication initiator protein n=1 Tax=Pseudomonas shahriarae TaxID=2745512 RepID=A0A9X4C6K5_9PSED|nr:RepB family plasmid replication initiator protein [Pseudomonas shahriarae]MDD1011037.1 RepB family plasmid replication initiator protein [Pseudomonas shahriarae]
MDTSSPRPRTKQKSDAPTGEDQNPPKRKRAPKILVVREIEPSKAVELKKAVEALAMRNVSTTSDFTFLQRKLYNTLTQFAQQRPDTEMVHDIPIKLVEEHVGHTTSNSRDHLKKVLKGMTQVQVEFDYKGESPGRKSGWGVANLIAEAYILDDNQTIRYSFPAELKRRLLDPTIFNLIDLRMQYHFTSYSALSLHELVSRYYGFSQKETFREHWTAWSVLLSGSATPHAEFRDFNKMLGRAVDQVNSIEGRFKIEVVVTKNNRKYDKLWFKLETLMQPELGLSPPPEIVGAEVSKRLKSLSLSAKDIEELGMNHDEEYLLAQADYTEAQMKKKDSVASPAAYFKAAVTNNYAKAPSKQKPVAPSDASAPAPRPQKAAKKPDTATQTAPGNQMNVLLEQWGAAQRTTIRDEINAKSPEEQQMLLAKYESQLKKDDLAYKQYKSKGLSPMVLNCLVAIIFADRFQEAPNSDQLLQFLLSTSAGVQA